MAKNPPNPGAVDSSGFDNFINKRGKVKPASDLGMKSGKWPTADQIGDEIRKTGAAGGTADTMRTSFQFLDPAYFDPLLFFIQHRDRRELNFRLRHAYEYEPVVGNLIDLHRTMPLSDYQLVCRDKTIENEFHSFADQIELLNLSSYVLGDYFLLGEAVLFKTFDDYNKVFKDITLLPPEKVEVRRTYLTKQPMLLLHVDAELKRLIASADPVDKEIVKMMEPGLVEKLRTQDRIPLPPHQAFMFANKTSESDLRGTSVLKRGLYALLLKYKLRMLHNAYIDRGCFPLKIFKVGDATSKWVPNRSHFDALRNQLAAAANDPDYAILYHYGLSVEYIGAKDKWENLLPHYEWCDKELMYALFANDALLQSKNATYSNANVSVRVLMSRYQMIRSQLELLWKNQIFRQMAEARDYWVPDRTGNTGDLPTKWRNGKSYYLDIPNFKWSKLNLLDDTAQKQFLMRLREKAEIPHKTVAEMFDLDPQELKEQLELEEGTVVDPIRIDVRRKAAQMPSVMSQVLAGRPSKEWVLESGTPEDEAKGKEVKKKDPTVDVHPGTAAPPSSGGGAPPPANIPARPPMGTPGQGTPPQNPPAESGINNRITDSPI